MAYDNTATVTGNVTRDPEHKVTNGGMSIANFGIAWNKRKQDGEDETSFFDVSCFRALADNVVQSTRIANVGISYAGTGELADSSSMGWLTRFFNSSLWPF